jgi:serine/threonine-protein kinase
VDAFVAAGGMGTVYRVYDLKRNVPLAMKVLHADLAEDPSVFKRFKREADSLEKLAHPNIVPFYGLHQAQDIAFLLEGYIDGPSFNDILRERRGTPLPIEEVLFYLKALCAALGYAHVHQVVHCDMKPGNVMVDRGGTVYLTDFGIARHAESTTTTLGFAGTPAYMAPEQIRAEPVSPATDVYALGVLLFRMLTGQRPFRGDEKGTESAGGTKTERTLYAHLHLQPPSPRRLNPAIPEALEQVVLNALAKDPAARYQSTQELFKACCAAVAVSPASVTDRLTLQEEEVTIFFPPPPQTPVVETTPSSQPWPREVSFSQKLRERVGILFVGGAGFLVLLFIGFWILINNTSTPTPTTQVPIVIVPSTSPTPVQITSTPGRTPTPVPQSSPAATIAPSPSTPLPLQVNPVDGAEFVYVPEGVFLMGSNPEDDPYFYGAEAPAHDVYLDEYWIYRLEVTNAMYQACVEQQACPRPAHFGSNTRQKYFGNPSYDDYPVVYVSWKNADAYCKWAGGRLPSEAEWEKAARGTDGRLFPWGDSPPTSGQANFGSNDTEPVGSHPEGASPYGALDMSGNVIEWVFDYFQVTYYQVSPEQNPMGPASGDARAYRGGAYHNEAEAVRTVNRGNRDDSYTNVDIGFRCAMDKGSQPEQNNNTLSDEPTGKIVFTCQVTRMVEQDQICIINADGSGFEQLTTDNSTQNLFPSLAPDGRSVVFVSDRTGDFEIYEMDTNGGNRRQLTSGLGKLNAPEISPDGRYIVFTNKSGGNTIWLMNRDGSNPRQIYGLPDGYGWDPVWSPDGSQILFASGAAQRPNLSIMDLDGSNVRQVVDMAGLRGRSDWSPDGNLIATYAGDSWQREIFVMQPDGSSSQQITSGGNNLAPSFSPDGQWLVFTSYMDRYGDDHGCEIYLMRTDGSDIRRLTDNNYCDYQPRWGP